MDFVYDQTQTGGWFRALTVMDVFAQDCLAAHPGRHLGAAEVVEVLRKTIASCGTPRRIYCDDVAQFSGRLADLWAYTNRVNLEFSRLGKPTDNTYTESFNGSLGDECLNVHWFEDLTDAKKKMQGWQNDYNESRPHRALNELSPL